MLEAGRLVRRVRNPGSDPIAEVRRFGFDAGLLSFTEFHATDADRLVRRGCRFS